MQTVTHGFIPIYNDYSKIIILGSMPSVGSRKVNFYYGNPNNRFYDVLSILFECEKPKTTEQKTKMLIENGIALFDVLSQCEIKGSSDSSIKNAKPNDLSPIFKAANIQKVFANGKTAYMYYKKFFDDDIICLPSTSPANAAYSLDKLVDAWAIIRQYV